MGWRTCLLKLPVERPYYLAFVILLKIINFVTDRGLYNNCYLIFNAVFNLSETLSQLIILNKASTKSPLLFLYLR